MITWRPAALLLLGAVGLAAFGAAAGGAGQDWVWPAAGGIAALVLLVSIVDIALAAAPKEITLTRDGDRTVWLGETATVRLTIHNGSSRPFDGRVRDTWVPSAGAAPYAHDVRVEPGARTTVETTLAPTRRGGPLAVRGTLPAYR